jgi:hypothetical protein
LRDPSASIRFDGTHDRCAVDADGSIYLFEHHVPDIGIRALHALEEVVHGHGQNEGVTRVVASDLSRAPGVIPGRETDVCWPYFSANRNIAIAAAVTISIVMPG